MLFPRQGQIPPQRFKRCASGRSLCHLPEAHLFFKNMEGGEALRRKLNSPEKMMSNVERQMHPCYIWEMKLSQYAKQKGISCRTALRWFRDGTIQGYQAP